MGNSSKDAEAARKELDRRGIPFSEEQFLRQIRSGNTDMVQLFLCGGMSPNAALDGKTSLTLAAQAGHDQIAELLLKAGANPLSLVSALKPRGTKDTWEKLASLSGLFTFMSSLMIAVVGWYFTNSYNERQLEFTRTQSKQEQANKEYQNRLAEMQTVEKMIPHLAADEESKRAALVAISILATPSLATRIAEVYGGQGSVDALTQIATANSADASSASAISALTSLAAKEASQGKSPARVALASVLQGKERAVAVLGAVQGSGNAPFCNGFVVDARRGWIVAPGYCLRAADARQVTVQVSDGEPTPVVESRMTRGNLLLFLRVSTAFLSQLELSSNAFRTGDTVTKLAFDLGNRDRSRSLSVAVGRVVDVGRMSFVDSDQPGLGLTVRMPEEAERAGGTGGAPLFDSEGNVACMTYQGSPAAGEQCVAAEEIRNAVRSVLAL